jgi:hypothetical protein
MAALGTICYAFIGPLLADSSPSADPGPTYLLAGACTAVLGALAWAIRQVVVWGKDGAAILYREVLNPLASSQRALMDTLNQTRKSDSEALTSLAADVHELNRNIRCRHEP